MANPTGTTYLSANPSYVWMDGDVYEIPQTDTTEGAATGASFAGLGVDNQPHQMLLNKINYLKNRLVQASSNVGTSGWYKLSSQDANLGTINIIEQWGTIPASGVTMTGNQAIITFNFPLAFTTVCWGIMPYIILLNTTMSDTPVVMPVAPFSKVSNALLFVGGTGFTQTLFTSTISGIGWRALGY
jgi:hypothetical protein